MSIPKVLSIVKEVRDIPTLTIGIDTDPYQNPRSYQYNESGMLLEGWPQSGNSIFGCSWFKKEFKTKEEAEKVKAELKTKLEEMYQDDQIRGAQFRITE